MTDSFGAQGEFVPADTPYPSADAAPELAPELAPNGFTRLGLAPELLRAVEDLGYTQPTAVQAQAIPLAMDSSSEGEAARFIDLMVSSQTGSGKTAAFGLPMLDKLCGGEPGLRGVIIVPTRELCVQVAENLRVYAQFAGLHVCTAFGGVDMSIQESAFKRGLDVLVACPGRLIDHLERRNISLERVQMVVLDEAHRPPKASSATSCPTPSACRSASAASRPRPSRTASSPAPSPTSSARSSACWSARTAAC